MDTNGHEYRGNRTRREQFTQKLSWDRPENSTRLHSCSFVSIRGSIESLRHSSQLHRSSLPSTRHCAHQFVNGSRKLWIGQQMFSFYENLRSYLITAAQQESRGKFRRIVFLRNPGNDDWQAMIQHRHASSAFAHQMIRIGGDAKIHGLQKE